MFEPACRGGSRRSLSISNPIPIWPCYPSEMVSSSPLPRTHFNTNTHKIDELTLRGVGTAPGTGAGQQDLPELYAGGRGVLLRFWSKFLGFILFF